MEVVRKDILPGWVQKPIMYSLLFLAVVSATKLTPATYFEGGDKCGDPKMRLIFMLVFLVLAMFLVRYLVSNFDWGQDWSRIFAVSVYLALVYFFVSSPEALHVFFGHTYQNSCVSWSRIGAQTLAFFAVTLAMGRLPISCI